MKRRSPETFSGEGELRASGASTLASYAIEGDPHGLRPGSTRLRGRLVTTAEAAAAAFQATEGVLVLEDGLELRAVMLAHTTGGCDVFVELRK